MTAAEFLGVLFAGRNAAHSIHLNTTSYAEHKALEGFYEAVIPLADKFAENYQGRYGRVGPIVVPAALGMGSSQILRDQLATIEAGREEVAPEDDTALQNIIDEIVELYLQTLYLLTLG